MSAHFPGPWSARFEHDRWIVEANGGHAVIAYGAGWHGEQQPGAANAALIAAAPELLEALRQAVPALEVAHNAGFKIDQSWLRLLRAAIAKAEGRAP